MLARASGVTSGSVSGQAVGRAILKLAGSILDRLEKGHGITGPDHAAFVSMLSLAGISTAIRVENALSDVYALVRALVTAKTLDLFTTVNGAGLAPPAAPTLAARDAVLAKFTAFSLPPTLMSSALVRPQQGMTIDTSKVLVIAEGTFGMGHYSTDVNNGLMSTANQAAGGIFVHRFNLNGPADIIALDRVSGDIYDAGAIGIAAAGADKRFGLAGAIALTAGAAAPHAVTPASPYTASIYRVGGFVDANPGRAITTFATFDSGPSDLVAWDSASVVLTSTQPQRGMPASALLSLLERYLAQFAVFGKQSTLDLSVFF